MENNGFAQFTTKINRFQNGANLRVLDLFSGCGGLSLGFQRAGFEIVGGVEIDPKAASSHAQNLFGGRPSLDIERHSQTEDITKTTPEKYRNTILLPDNRENDVDIIVGGPPCQAFARIGRAKLQDLSQHPEDYLLDQRANLYIRLLQYVDYFKPLAVLIENVPDILNYGKVNIAEEIIASLNDLGYISKYSLLNCANFGVPQNRIRFFLIAYPAFLELEPAFPAPTHHVDLPNGYRQILTSSLKLVLQNPYNNYIGVHEPVDQLNHAVGAKAALDDLPVINEHLEIGAKQRIRKFGELIPYRNGVELSLYVRDLMCSWPGFEAGEGIIDHVIRYLPRDYEIFRRMNYGDEYPRAQKIAIEILNRELQRIFDETGINVRGGSEEYQRLYKKHVPPYDPSKFANKWWKLVPENPSRTLTAHIGKDTYSHIHYDSNQARVISVREAARLQSFPDGFRFSGPMNDAYRQIGNSVPPLMSYSLAEKIKESLRTHLVQHLVYGFLTRNEVRLNG